LKRNPITQASEIGNIASEPPPIKEQFDFDQGLGKTHGSMGFIVVGFYGFYFFLLSMRLSTNSTNFTSYLVHSLVES
jgi:hypothetical protein